MPQGVRLLAGAIDKRDSSKYAGNRSTIYSPTRRQTRTNRVPAGWPGARSLARKQNRGSVRSLGVRHWLHPACLRGAHHGGACPILATPHRAVRGSRCVLRPDLPDNFCDGKRSVSPSPPGSRWRFGRGGSLGHNGVSPLMGLTSAGLGMIGAGLLGIPVAQALIGATLIAPRRTGKASAHGAPPGSGASLATSGHVSHRCLIRNPLERCCLSSRTP